MAKLGMFCWFSYYLPIRKRLQLIKNAGFEATSLWWDSDDNHDGHPDLARQIGLEIYNIHAPFYNRDGLWGADDLWCDNQGGVDYLNLLISCVEDCRRHSVPTLVIHLAGFREYVVPTALGLKRIEKLVEIAEKKNINLAFENLRYLEHLGYVFENVNSRRIGFCYDNGHEHCNHPGSNCLEKYGDKLMVVHFHDNFGSHDSHLLPFDGSFNWDEMAAWFKKPRSIDYHTLEVDFFIIEACFDPTHPDGRMYQNVTAKEYVNRAFKRAERLEELLKP